MTSDEKLQKLVLHFFNKGKYELQNFIVDFENKELDIIDLLDKWKDPENGIFNSSEQGSDSRSQNSKRSSRTKNTSKNTMKTKQNSSRRGEEVSKENEVKHNRERFEFD